MLYELCICTRTTCSLFFIIKTSKQLNYRSHKYEFTIRVVIEETQIINKSKSSFTSHIWYQNKAYEEYMRIQKDFHIKRRLQRKVVTYLIFEKLVKIL